MGNDRRAVVKIGLICHLPIFGLERIYGDVKPMPTLSIRRDHFLFEARLRGGSLRRSCSSGSLTDALVS